MYNEVILTPIRDSVRLVDVSDEIYFSKEYGKYISNSSLALINPAQGGSPSKYKAGLAASHKQSGSLFFGSAVHEMVLQPESFVVANDINRPTAKLGLMADYLYDRYFKSGLLILNEDFIKASDYVDYYKGKMDEKKINFVRDHCTEYWEGRKQFENNYKGGKTPIYLDPASRDKLSLCMTSFGNNKDIYDILTLGESKNEQTLLLDVKASYQGKNMIMPLKAKLDNFELSDNLIVLNDLKTTGHWLDKFGESFEQYHYYRQMAMYVWMLYLYCEHIGMDTQAADIYVNMLLVSTIPDYRSGVYRVTNGAIRRGITEMKDLLQRVAYATITNNFEDGYMDTSL